MKLQNWAQIAEISSGVAIVISLVMLVVEVQQNTSAVQASTYDRLLSDHTQWRMNLATDTDAMEAYLLRMEQAIPSPEELRDSRGRQVWISGIMLWERAYFAREYGTLGDSEWQRYESNMCESDVQYAIQDLEFFVSAEFWRFLSACRSDAE